VTEPSPAVVQEESRRLGIGNAAADVANCVVDMAVGNQQIERAIQVDVEEQTSKAQGGARGNAHASGNRDARIASVFRAAVQTGHFVIKVGYYQSGVPTAVEIADIQAHARAGF